MSNQKSDSEDNEIEADVILNINNMQEFERQLNEGSAPKQPKVFELEKQPQRELIIKKVRRTKKSSVAQLMRSPQP